MSNFCCFLKDVLNGYIVFLQYVFNMQGILLWAQTGLIFIFFKLMTSTCGDFIITVIEGEVAHLDFLYDCNSTAVTLQDGYRSPFYRSPKPKSIPLAAYPESRFVLEKVIKDDRCSIYLTINPVQRNDSATYIAQVYRDGDILPELHRIGLNVLFPPGKASCDLSEESGVVGWGLVRCDASVGSLSGQFDCYQRDERLPPHTTLLQNERIIEQTIWVSLSHPVFCCTTTRELPIDQCECKDFVWDPSNYQKSNRAVEPCTATLQVPSTIPQSPIFEYTESETGILASPLGGTKEESVLQLLKWVYGMAAGLFVLIVLCLITCIKLITTLCKKTHYKKTVTVTEEHV